MLQIMQFALSLFVVMYLLQNTLAQWVHLNSDAPQEENEECAKEEGRVWFCKKATDCPGVKAALRTDDRLRTSSWQGHTHIVCCPPESPSQPNKLSISEKKCSEYESRLCRGSAIRGSLNNIVELQDTSKNKVRRFNKRFKRQNLVSINETTNSSKTDEGQLRPGSSIGGQPSAPAEFPHMNGNATKRKCSTKRPAMAAIGGENSKPREHPHMALIGYGSEGDISWQCGGSLISERFVLSAAHCSLTAYGLARWVRLGDLDIHSQTEDARPQQFEIVERMVHSDYQSPAFYNDIVLFRLDRAAVLDQYVAPACLYPGLGDPSGTGIATGWGKNETNGPRSSSLIKVELKFIPIEDCKQNVGIIKNVLPSGINSQTMMCAGEPGKDTCQGDSGGPLVLAGRRERCLARQVGVTSFGPKNCGQSHVTGTYVRVAHFLPWIESIVWPTD